jgi:Tol biopolymer transport system component
LTTGDRKVIFRGGVFVRYLPSGHLLYALGDNLLAVAFDVARGELRGAPITVLEDVQRSARGSLLTGGAHVDVSTSGTLVYVPGSFSGIRSPRTMAIVDWTGAARQLPLPARPYSHPRVAPDGQRLVVAVDEGREASIWVVEDFTSGGASARQLTFGGRNHYPIWSHDGLRVTYQSDREGDLSLFEQLADGSRPAERLTKAERGTAHIPNAWSPDGQTLVFHVSASPQPATLWTMTRVGDRTPKRLTAPRGSFGAYNAVFSPDGRWLAYTVSSVAGAGVPPAVFVEPFPPTGAQYRVAVGANPAWSRVGGPLFYETFGGTANSRVFAIEVRWVPAPTFRPVATIPVGPTARVTLIEGYYDITPDGKQLVVIREPQVEGGQMTRGQINVVVNWMEELKRLVPTK